MQPPAIDPALGLALVTGASGFVGSRLVQRLRAAGRPVRALSRSAMPALADAGAEVVRADVTDADAVARACRGAETVYHVAAKVGIWGRAADFERTNIDGTRLVIDACRSAGVRRLVFTSSPSVVFNDADLAGADESLPLGTTFPADYPRTKAAAEALALAASDPGRLRIVGPGTNKVDLTHIDNVVDAHVLAETALARPDSPAAGRAYFVTNGEPVLLWPWINDILARLDVPPLAKRLSLARARRIGAVCEALWRILPLGGEPPMTRFLAAELAKDHWFDISAARRDLGYQPRVSMAAGVATLVPWLRETLR
jgi:nucleoside-diphosphate-sugar epimerase